MRAELIIAGTDATGANYITWTPMPATIRLIDAGGAIDPPLVELRNRDSAVGGQITFFDVVPGVGQERLQLSLPTDGTPVALFVAGKFGRASENSNDAVIEVIEQIGGGVIATNSLMVRIRKNANRLTEGERDRFLFALASINAAGNGLFTDFRAMHTAAGDPEAHGNAGFLPWHRSYLLDLERELQAVDPSVTLPYWRFDQIARNLFTRSFMGVADATGTVQFDPSNPLLSWVSDGIPGILRRPFFNTSRQSAFVISEQETLLLGSMGALYENFRSMEANPHGFAHTSFGGFLSSVPTAARDPLFFMLHANVDRLWAKWQWFFRRFDDANTTTYSFPGSAGDPGSTRIGHNLLDSMWPWNGDVNAPRPTTAPGGAFATSPTVAAPGSSPLVRDMIDYLGVMNIGSNLGFAYDDVPFDF